MRFADMTDPRLLSIGLALQEPHAIVETLVRSLADIGAIANADEVAAMIHEAEERYGSWGIGSGVTWPHLKTRDVDRLHMAIGTLPGGVNWKNVDDGPVRIVFLLIIPIGEPGNYLRLADRIYRLRRDPKLNFQDRLVACRSPDEAWRLLLEMDQVKLD